ncbi:pullulanase-type alpha-1,6-glucosidase [Rheinheimera sp. EpRS3]|uniref:pullulanase-type alpha-1,6-glucosidase n=1 Tax=Rheinheimera sp. EpRS3 TaxID=1712383 RepID=UPI000747BA84|nr:pullulanase-type alpha-1,6-glucosidase [Rheinheimera sp. EpRS3]KUM51954.1 pullulanase [Rheinheimera sp. EpRS3]
MTTTIKLLKLSALALAAHMLAACGGGDSTKPGEVLLTCNVPQIPDAAGTACIDPPPIKCKKPSFPSANNESCIIGYDPDAPDPVVMAGANQAVLYYKRSDGNYTDWILHTWNNESCDAYEASSVAPSWEGGLVHNGVDVNYGAYWVLNIKPGYAGTEGACGNFIVHKGDEKDLSDADMKMPLTQQQPEGEPDFSRMNWTFSAKPDVYQYPVVSLGVSIAGAAAHWIDQHTFVWSSAIAATAAEVKLHHAADASLEVDFDEKIPGSALSLTPVPLTDEQKALVPHLAEQSAFSLDLGADETKAMLKNQLVLAAYDSENVLLDATWVQAAKVLDDLYTKADNDADEASLGVIYEGGNITAKVWAPTARSVNLKVYDATKTLTATHAMTADSETGIWSYAGSSALDRQFYRYEVTVYHPQTRKVETTEATDPYSVSVSTNGRYSQFVNLDDDDLKPTGWDDRTVPTVAKPEDIVIYEGHVRDFSIRDQSVTAANRGKYLAFTETNSEPVKHLKSLADNGLTHFHILPLNDQANINEDASRRIELTDTVGRLCQLNAAAPVCGNTSADESLLSVLESYSPFGEKAQELVQAIRGIDGFNWGYDPQHFIAPEGSYASNPDGVARVTEVRAMNKALNDLGLRTVLDVVYNHTSTSGVSTNSVFDKIVPGYYHRYNPVSGAMERSTCCENTATEHRMFEKFMQDSMVILARDFGFNDFRYDVMGHHPKDSILATRDIVRSVAPDVYFYGEGWNFGEVANNRLFVQAKQQDMAGSGVGTFNDRLRDEVRDAVLFSNAATEENLRKQDLIRIGLAGTLKDYVLQSYQGIAAPASSYNWDGQAAGYAEKPADIINYVSKHDNETLWDQLQYGLAASVSIDERVRVHNIAIAIPLMSQGIPFLQMGDDFLRSKSMDRDSYDSGDWFNFVDFSMQTNNFAIGLPPLEKNEANWQRISNILTNPNAKPAAEDIRFASDVFKEFLSIRTGSNLFRLVSADDVIARVGFHNIGKSQTQGLIVMSIDDGAGLTDLDPMLDALVVVINGTPEEQSHTVRTAAGFDLHPIQQASADTRVHTASFSQGADEGTFTVPAQTMAVFVKQQQGAQGTGLAADATTGAPDIPPYEATTIYVRGGMNGWGEVDAFNYEGDGIYMATIDIAAGSYEFKLASGDWSTVDFGAGVDGQSVTLGQAKTLNRGGANLQITIANTATYVFVVDATNKDAPVLTVQELPPYGVGVTVYLKGDMNTPTWSNNDPMTYIGSDVYSIDVTLNAIKTYEFKFADANWAAVNYGAQNGAFVLGQGKTLESNGGNLSLDVTEVGTYRFSVNATNSEAPVMTITKL